MKTVFILFSLVLGFSFAAQATLECVGQDEDKNVSMSVLDISPIEVDENVKGPVAVRVVEKIINAKGYEAEKILFAGVIDGESEDVQWFLTSKDEKSLIGTIYLDELYDVGMNVAGRKIRFNCGE